MTHRLSNYPTSTRVLTCSEVYFLSFFTGTRHVAHTGDDHGVITEGARLPEHEIRCVSTNQVRACDTIFNIYSDILYIMIYESVYKICTLSDISICSLSALYHVLRYLLAVLRKFPLNRIWFSLRDATYRASTTLCTVLILLFFTCSKTCVPVASCVHPYRALLVL